MVTLLSLETPGRDYVSRFQLIRQGCHGQDPLAIMRYLWDLRRVLCKDLERYWETVAK
jgi:hypothetical protein